MGRENLQYQNGWDQQQIAIQNSKLNFSMPPIGIKLVPTRPVHASQAHRITIH